MCIIFILTYTLAKTRYISITAYYIVWKDGLNIIILHKCSIVISMQM